ncbi:MAG: hypothetical protein AVDCRST_MAG01-01-3789 [uncultured Rubrobacteraceae bacterium]|uniref:Uncharacterized protein n=1 Tax=uncultured Rubrobacteraceae bacterium TaxID=349277 RepID=A0A6J4QEF0_9ACTN|nr:MAG: hypothetical protein AVDCRST_MAG01-01-3789 [uncultured Rubrobacteraceae bacterium]
MVLQGWAVRIVPGYGLRPARRYRPHPASVALGGRGPGASLPVPAASRNAEQMVPAGTNTRRARGRRRISSFLPGLAAAIRCAICGRVCAARLKCTPTCEISPRHPCRQCWTPLNHQFRPADRTDSQCPRRTGGDGLAGKDGRVPSVDPIPKEFLGRRARFRGVFSCQRCSVYRSHTSRAGTRIVTEPKPLIFFFLNAIPTLSRSAFAIPG